MSLVVVASAKGSPGVTTLTVALAALTAGGIAADLDPDGGDLALRYRAGDGAPLDPDTGLLSLAASLRREPGDRAGTDGAVEAHLQVAAGGLDLLLGVATPDQAIGLGPLWSPLGRALAASGRTIFADCGRVSPSSPAMPVLLQADAVVMVARAELEELAHLRERLRFLTAALASGPGGPHRIGVVLVAGERDRAAAPRTGQLLRSSGLAVPVLGTVADDARGAARLRGQGGGSAGRTTLVRSVRSLLPVLATLAGIRPGAPRPGSGPVSSEPVSSGPGAKGDGSGTADGGRAVDVLTPDVTPGTTADADDTPVAAPVAPGPTPQPVRGPVAVPPPVAEPTDRHDDRLAPRSPYRPYEPNPDDPADPDDPAEATGTGWPGAGTAGRGQTAVRDRSCS